MSSITMSFPIPPSASEIISKTTVLLVAVNERPYFFQVKDDVGGISPESQSRQ